MMVTQHDGRSAQWSLSMMVAQYNGLYDVVCDAVCGVVCGVVFGVVRGVVRGVVCCFGVLLTDGRTDICTS